MAAPPDDPHGRNHLIHRKPRPTAGGDSDLVSKGNELQSRTEPQSFDRAWRAAPQGRKGRVTIVTFKTSPQSSTQSGLGPCPIIHRYTVDISCAMPGQPKAPSA